MDLVVCKDFNAAVAEFEKYCADEANLNVSIQTDCYPMKVCLTPANVQQSMFTGEEGEDNEETAAGCITINLGVKPKFKSTLKFQMDAALLKKLIKKATKLGDLYLHAFREITEAVIEDDEHYIEDTRKTLRDLCVIEE